MSGTFSQTIPPFARITCPFTHPASALNKNDTTRAISSGSPSRPNGLRFASRATCSSLFPSKNSSVATGPGATAFTVIDRPRSSFARIDVKTSTAAFVAQ